MIDFWTEHPKVLSDLIIDALGKNDLSTLSGIQCFSEATRWTYLQGIESIINTILHETIRAKREAQKLKQRLQSNEEYYKSLGVYTAMMRRMKIKEQGKIPFLKVKNICKELSAKAFLENLKLLERFGYIATDRTGGNWDNSYVWLPKNLWNGYIEDILSKGREENVYISSLGTMVAYSIIGAKIGKTIKTLRAIVSVLNRHPSGEVFEDEIIDEYRALGLSVRKWYNFRERDAAKAEDIRAIVHYDGHKVIFNREMVQVNKLWRDLTIKRLHSISRRRLL